MAAAEEEDEEEEEDDDDDDNSTAGDSSSARFRFPRRRRVLLPRQRQPAQPSRREAPTPTPSAVDKAAELKFSGVAAANRRCRRQKSFFSFLQYRLSLSLALAQ